MRHSRHPSLGFLVAMLLVLPGSQAVAGGLVDTSTERFETANFTNPQSITNPWWTLTEGRNFLYFAQDGEDCVWNLTEVLGTTGPSFFGPYAGTNARIVLDRGWVDEGCASGQNFAAFIGTNPPLEEVTYDWYAQDDARNIWYMGEHTFDGDFGGSFAAGCDGAEAGIVVLGDPFKGAFYRQELYEGEAEDWGKVLNFKNADGLMCMTTKEWTPLEHGRIEHKQYCSDGAVGTLSRIEELHGKTVIVELVDTNIPSPPLGVIPVNPIPSCAAP